MKQKTAADLLQKIRNCRACAGQLPFEPRPVLRFSSHSKIMIVGQAPGTRVHESGIPWNDPSGERLREWLALTPEEFYNPEIFAIVPMGFCYPGRGKSGDLPPRPECAKLWMDQVVQTLKHVKLKVLIGQYAHKHFLGHRRQATLTETVKHWRNYLPEAIVLPHPSPRNNIWLRRNPWFSEELLVELPALIRRHL